MGPNKVRGVGKNIENIISGVDVYLAPEMTLMLCSPIIFEARHKNDDLSQHTSLPWNTTSIYNIHLYYQSLMS